MHILMVEDDADLCGAVEIHLKKAGHTADMAYDGEDGLHFALQNAYDLILLDLKMPGLSGEDVLSEIRKEDPFIDVIIYTNYSNFADVKKLVNIGIEGYINKGPSADLSELIIAIKRRLEPLSEEAIGALLKDVPDTNE